MKKQNKNVFLRSLKRHFSMVSNPQDLNKMPFSDSEEAAGRPSARGKIYFCFVFFLVLFFLLLVPAVQAQVIGNFDFLKGIVPCGTSYAPAPCTVCHFYKLIQNIINFLLLISSSLVTLMAVYIGFLFLFSGGNPKMITDAKSKLWLLVWGLVWVLGSWLVLNTIITVFANPSVFPTPWNQISCEISQSPGGGNIGGGNIGGGGNEGNGKIDFSDAIFEDVRADIDIPSGEVKITNETTGKTESFDLTTEGAGIAHVREKYPNVFIIGGDISMKDAIKLRNGLDFAMLQLPDDYKNLENSYILVSANEAMHDQMAAVSSSKPWEFKNGRSFISNLKGNNTMVLGAIAGGENDYSLRETLIHELAHQRDGVLSGRYGGDSEWVDLYIEAKQIGGAFVSDYAKTDVAEDLAETVTVATLGDDVARVAYTGDKSKDEILAKKYEYLKRKGYIKNIP